MPSDNERPHIFIKNEPAPAVKREYDGGGGGTYQRTSYKIHAEKVHAEVDQLRAIFSSMEDRNIGKRYYRVALPEGEKVSTSTGTILENNLNSLIVGSPSENIAHVSTTSSSFDDLVTQLAKYKDTDKSVGKSKYALIEDFSQIPFEEKISERFLSQFEEEDKEGEAIITFFSDLNEEEIFSIKDAVTKYLEDRNSMVLSFVPGEEGALIKVKSKKSILKDLARMFLSIQSLDSADEIFAEMATVGEPVKSNITVVPNNSKAYACLFDTGISSDIRFIKGSVIEDVRPLGEHNGVGTTHGTFVASRIIYRDSIKDQISTGTLSPDVRILSVCTSKYDDIGNRVKVTVDQLISLIRDTVEKWHNQIRVYNLSMSCIPTNSNASPAIKDDIVHPLAAEIDSLSRKYDVLFVLCTGNIPYSDLQNHPTVSYPKYFSENSSRIMPPAESMLGLTVGSVAYHEAEGSMAKKGDPSPFTRRGPGFAGYHKPDLVAHGGNCGNNWSTHDFLNVVGFSTDGDHIAYGRGTSYSAPVITRLAAKMFELIPTASSCLVKAILIHFCEMESNGNIDEGMLKTLLGNGAPVGSLLTASTRNMQTYLYQGEMDYRDMIEIPFYVPTPLINRKGREKVNVKITISFSPETSSVLKTGYCKSHVRTKIIKLDKDGNHKDVAFSKSKILDDDRYSTVVRMEKSFSNAISAGEWKVLVAHESRWSLKNPKTKFAVVVTIEDPKNDPGIDIYAAIRSEIPNKYRTEIQIPTRLRV